MLRWGHFITKNQPKPSCLSGSAGRLHIRISPTPNPAPRGGEFFKAGKNGASPRLCPPRGVPLPDFGGGGGGGGYFGEYAIALSGSAAQVGNGFAQTGRLETKNTAHCVQISDFRDGKAVQKVTADRGMKTPAI